ncbi:hypothetical protein IMSAGC004_02301 [Bacteroidaceae bacterium]|nr:hypothetical protein IMSAGC004_02301 [Bacteroidaceae bacterium]
MRFCFFMQCKFPVFLNNESYCISREKVREIIFYFWFKVIDRNEELIKKMYHEEID